jgi:biopolymer transport protein TolQ
MLAMLQSTSMVPNSLWELLQIAKPATQVVLGITAVFSLFSWFVIILKAWQFRRLRSQSNRLLVALEGAPKLQDATRVVGKLPTSSLSRIFREAMNFYSELVPGAAKEGPPAKAQISTTQLEGLKMVLGKEVGQERDGAARMVSSLATIGSVSPLLGLLGTVLGVMDAFLGMGHSGSGNIAAVAPGIAEALITTVAGIAAAIPALMAYNYFAAQTARFEGELESFANGLVGWMAREGWV